jgi:rRNA small subunit pseudouridine methyltransferase Nep1
MRKPHPSPRPSPRAVITLVLAEAELELVPAELHKHPKLVARAKKRRRSVEHLLLDQAVDHEAMKELPNGDRRGRPDIAHMWMLLALDSLLSRRRKLRVLVHTRSDELIRVSEKTRIMRSQTKFYQLMEDLLRQGRVPLQAPLLTMEPKRSLDSIVREEARGTKVLMDVGGDLWRAPEFAAAARASTDITLMTGGFPRGSFRQAKPAWFDRVVRVADEELTVWSAMVPALAGLEDGAR